jgi:hypothetical protein
MNDDDRGMTIIALGFAAVYGVFVGAIITWFLMR